MTADETEIRFDAPTADVQILDAYWMAEGTSRKEVLSSLLHEWAQRQVHRATLIMRVTAGNPLAAADERQKSGKGTP